MMTFIAEFIEMSVVVFVFHYGTASSNAVVLLRTCLLSGFVTLLDHVAAVCFFCKNNLL